MLGATHLVVESLDLELAATLLHTAALALQKEPKGTK